MKLSLFQCSDDYSVRQQVDNDPGNLFITLACLDLGQLLLSCLDKKKKHKDFFCWLCEITEFFQVLMEFFETKQLID